MTSLARLQLINRRAAEVTDFEHGGRRWTATISRLPDGRIAEIFLDGAKASPLADLARETAIVASLALQYGAPLKTIRHAIASHDASPLGEALSLFDGQNT